MATTTQHIMQASKEFMDLILKGGTVIKKWGHHEASTVTCLVRMPKGKFIRHEDEEFGVRHFEYAWVQNYGENPDELLLAGWRNGHVRGVKKDIEGQHYEHAHAELRKAKLEAIRANKQKEGA